MNDITHVNGKYDWGIDALVAQLRDLRVQSLETRSRRDKPPKLPSRKELQVILDGLGAVLFPNRLGLPDLNDEGIDYFVGHTLETLLRKLYKQISRELHFISGTQGVDEAAHEQAIIIARQFAAQLPTVRKLLDRIFKPHSKATLPQEARTKCWFVIRASPPSFIIGLRIFFISWARRWLRALSPRLLTPPRELTFIPARKSARVFLSTTAQASS